VFALHLDLFLRREPWPASRSQNNMFIFPGVGLGVIGAGAHILSDRFFFDAAQALADSVDDVTLASGKVRARVWSVCARTCLWVWSVCARTCLWV
jgi:hypothetical protein